MNESFTDNRPWGSFRQFTNNEKTTVKLLYIKIGQELSLQSHKNREEFWNVISGFPILNINNKILKAKPRDEFFIKKGVRHRISTTDTPVIILEISYGDFNEDDIVRYEDRYGRV